MIGALLVVALSQTSPKVEKAKAPPPQHEIFGDEEVNGGIKRPGVDSLLGLRPAVFPSLIQLRMSMQDKLHDSADNL